MLSSSILYILRLETGSPTEPTARLLARLAGCPHAKLGLQLCVTLYPAGGPNTGLHVCVAGTSVTEPFP